MCTIYEVFASLHFICCTALFCYFRQLPADLREQRRDVGVETIWEGGVGMVEKRPPCRRTWNGGMAKDMQSFSRARSHNRKSRCTKKTHVCVLQSCLRVQTMPAYAKYVYFP